MNNVIHVDFRTKAVQQETSPARPSEGWPRPLSSLELATIQGFVPSAGPAPGVEPSPVPEKWFTRDEAIAAMREALRQRSGKAWTVKGGRGTTWGWIDIVSPPRRLVDGSMSDVERAELRALLNLEGGMVATQGVSIPAGSDYYAEYVARCRGEAPRVFGKPYWD